MIKPLTGVELSSSKARSGMTCISELIPRLIRSYEIQAELAQRREETNRAHVPPASPARSPRLPTIDLSDSSPTQATFGWF